jgi:hypothetical protein
MRGALIIKEEEASLQYFCISAVLLVSNQKYWKLEGAWSAPFHLNYHTSNETHRFIKSLFTSVNETQRFY